VKDPGTRLDADYFRQSPVDCARGLIGGLFEWEGAGGVIVETEAYAATGDAACHTAFRPSAREFLDHHSPGDAYVYLNYGVHWLFNVTVKGAGGDGFVLFRALEPVFGIPAMKRRRGMDVIEGLCSGPGKLTKALGIGESDHGREFLTGSRTGISCGKTDVPVQAGPRVGISRAQGLPWRFCAVDSACLSRP